MALLTDRKFIHFNRKSDFEALLNANAISDKQIVFLKDAQEIWTHGTYYGSVEQFLDETNKDSTNAVSAAAVYQALADDEEVIAAALNDLNDRIENLDIPIKYITVNGTALTPDSNKVVDITIPEGELSTNYEPSSLDNEDLELAAGDTYEEAFSKLEKSINDNEQITAAALTNLDSRINTLNLPQSLDDISDGSTRKLSDYATTTLLATKQDALVSGTNIKTINNESILGSGNITIQGTLNTNNTTAQTVNSSESLNGTVNLHKIAKTGNYNDLNNKPMLSSYNMITTTVPNVTSVGSASTWSFAMGTGNDEHTLIISGGNGTAPSLGTAKTVATGGLAVGGAGAFVYSPSDSTGGSND